VNVVSQGDETIEDLLSKVELIKEKVITQPIQ